MLSLSLEVIAILRSFLAIPPPSFATYEPASPFRLYRSVSLDEASLSPKKAKPLQLGRMPTFKGYVFSIREITTPQVIEVVCYGGKSAFLEGGMRVETTILMMGNVVFRSYVCPVERSSLGFKTYFYSSLSKQNTRQFV